MAERRKIDPENLSNILDGQKIPTDENVLLGIEGFENAGVYRIVPETASSSPSMVTMSFPSHSTVKVMQERIGSHP